MKHLEIMPILEASEMISVKFSHEDKDLSILPIFGAVSNRHILFFLLQSPDFHKPGPCYVVKLLYLCTVVRNKTPIFRNI